MLTLCDHSLSNFIGISTVFLLLCAKLFELIVKVYTRGSIVTHFLSEACVFFCLFCKGRKKLFVLRV